MQTEVKTERELAIAILSNAAKIHIADAKLAAHMINRPQKHRFSSYAMLMNGYKLNIIRFFGVIDVSLIKQT